RLWFTTSLGVGSITTTGQVTTFPLPNPASPVSIADGGDGSVWVTEDTIPRIDRITAAGAVSSVALPAGVSGFSITRSGRAMVFMDAGGHTLWRGRTPMDLHLVERIGLSGERPKTFVSEYGGAPGLIAGPFGTLWIAASFTTEGGSSGGVAVVNTGGRCIVPDL